MIISISLVLLLLAVVGALIYTGRMPVLGALLTGLLGFYAADTPIAPPLNSATAACLDVFSQISSHIA
ncbi:hypothetical protein [Streptomyces nanshensis]|uniref:Uncharacterized protein n=1 Tax=Streptomyces nanshensis TaxID=518642 RepID=A0A1E7KSJ4_9ACTN|nr:hypothetical protein [Streptomyces nanshensis]OEV06898.1 hypothetical protein AN218_29810 [Streptomyces nanshensis]